MVGVQKTKRSKEQFKAMVAEEATNFKCPVCGIYCESDDYIRMKEKYGIQNEWLGCDDDDCDVWGHARPMSKYTYQREPEDVCSGEIPYHHGGVNNTRLTTRYNQIVYFCLCIPHPLTI